MSVRNAPDTGPGVRKLILLAYRPWTGKTLSNRPILPGKGDVPA